MNLSNFAEHIDTIILYRGKEYATEGRVISLKSVADGEYTAIVRGGEDYEVDVELDDEGNIIDSECDCPYDFGLTCKHQVAVFFELRKKLADPTFMQLTPSHQQPSLRQLMEKAEKEQLVELLLSLATDSDMVEERIRFQLSRREANEEIEVCRQLIRLYIRRHADHHGFVNWRDVSGAVEGAQLVAGQAEAAFEDEDWLRGLELLFCVVDEMIELMQSADDSGGDIGMVISSCLEAASELVERAEHIPADDQLMIFRRLLDETAQSYYDEWSEWQLELLESASVLIASDEMQRMWDEAAEAIGGHSPGVGLTRNYEYERIVKLRYEQLLKRSDGEQAREYVYQHVHLPDMREIAIRGALEQGMAEEAIRLAEAGEEQDRELTGLVFRWKKYRYEAYRLLGQVELQRRLGQELIVNGEYAYYASVKETFSDGEQWTLYLQNLLDQVQRSSHGMNVYTRILTEENMWARLLEYVRQSPYRVEQFYKELLPHYPQEVWTLFVSLIKQRAEQARDRRNYADVARIIRLLQKIGGKEEASAVTRELLERFSRRPAFQDELGKIRL